MKGAIALAVLAVMFASVAVAYSLWSDKLTVKVQVETGELDMKISSFSITDRSCGGGDPDYNIVIDENGKPDFTHYSPLNEPNSDVACASGQLLDTDNDGDSDTLLVNIGNAYPRYYNEISFSIVNNGNIPLKIEYIEIDAGSDCGRLVGKFYTLDSLRDRDGLSIDINSDGKPDVAISVSDGLGELLKPGEAINSYKIQIAVLDDAPESSSLTFCVKPVAVPWNAYQAPS